MSRGADVSIRDHDGRTRPEVVWEDDTEERLGDPRQPPEYLLGGFTTVKVVEARPDSLIVRVEGHHGRFPDAEREAKERGTLTVATKLFGGDVPEPGQLIRCREGLSPTVDEAWSHARRKDLGVELAR